MKWKIIISVLLLTGMSGVYADESPTDQQGAQEYDWQSCVTNRTNQCLNACMNSEDISCNDKCNAMAADKCRELGLQP